MDLLNEWDKHKQTKKDENDYKNVEKGENIFKEPKGKAVEEKIIKCKICRDTGMIIDVKNKKSVKCNHCHSYNILNQLNEVHIDVVNDRADELGIPTVYKEKEFLPELIKKNEAILRNFREDPMMELYIRKLNYLHNQISVGVKLENSFIIMAPQGYSKNHFVYCSIREALKYGYSVAPYMDTEEWLELKIKDKVKFKEYLRRDLVFVKLLPAYISVDDTQMMKYIVDKRARLDLPTIVTSRFNTSFLHYVELHLENNIGLIEVEKYDYSKLKEITGIYPRDYSNLVKKLEDEEKKRKWREKQLIDGKSKIHDSGILSKTEIDKHGYKETHSEQYSNQYLKTYGHLHDDSDVNNNNGSKK